MTEISRYSGRSNDIVTREFVDMRTQLEQHRKRLTNASASAENGNFLGRHGAGSKGASCGLGSEFSDKHGGLGFEKRSDERNEGIV
jgi:hypothetical protein